MAGSPSARRPQSRWIDSEGRFTAMDRFMRPSHSGVLGNPLTSASLSTALVSRGGSGGSARHKPPTCASKDYDVLGRTDPLALGASDQAAFDSLHAMLTAVDPDDLASRPASPLRSRTSSTAASRPMSAKHSKEAVGDGVADTTPTRQARGQSDDHGAADGVVDQFPPSPTPGDDSDGARGFGVEVSVAAGRAGAHSSTSSPVRRPAPRRSHQQRRQSRPASGGWQQRSQQLIQPWQQLSSKGTTHSPASSYSWSPSSRFFPGAVPEHRPLVRPAPPASSLQASSAAPWDSSAARTGLPVAGSSHSSLQRPSTATSDRVRSPNVLASFGAKFAEEHGFAGHVGHASSGGLIRPASRGSTSSFGGGGLRPSSSALSLRSDASGRSHASHASHARSMHSRSAGARKPPEPIVPLIAPLPRPVLEKAGGRGRGPASHSELSSTASQASIGDSASAMRYAAIRAQGGVAAQATLRLLIADMMVGMQDEHAGWAVRE